MFTLEHNGFKAKIKKAPKLVDNGAAHGLPPGSDIEVFPVDAFKHPLPSWITGAGNFVVPVQPEWGLWFDWRENDSYNCAVMPTIKGMNPITGQKTQGYALEHYLEKCPVHGIPFKDGLFCEKCNYRWPSQNYIAAPNVLWWDGFRTSDGEVRQFFFTADMLKSIPERVLGAKETVPAFGFCFYRPKEAKERPRGGDPRALLSINNNNHGFQLGDISETSHVPINSNYHGLLHALTSGQLNVKCCDIDPVEACCTTNATFATFATLANCTPTFSGNIQPAPEEKYRDVSSTMDWMMVQEQMNAPRCCSETKTSSKISKNSGISGQSVRHVIVPDVAKNVEVGVGAGAKIRQDLQKDIYSLESWAEEPASVMRLYFVFEEQYREIRAKGMNDLIGDKEGFLSGLPVG